MIAQRFDFIRDFTKAWNNSVYFQLRKMPYGFKDQARFCPSGEKCGLTLSTVSRCLYNRSIIIRIQDCQYGCAHEHGFA
jgi:hypothetical protein